MTRLDKGTNYYGQKIISAELKDDELQLGFDDGRVISIMDNGQSCCEYRHMTTDDNLSSVIGCTLTRIDEKPGPDLDDGNGNHEQMFLEIGTDKGFITIVNHNEHNGYYGGFVLDIMLIRLPHTNAESH